jgi:hypothetical protein
MAIVLRKAKEFAAEPLDVGDRKFFYATYPHKR